MFFASMTSRPDFSASDACRLTLPTFSRRCLRSSRMDFSARARPSLRVRRALIPLLNQGRLVGGAHVSEAGREVSAQLQFLLTNLVPHVVALYAGLLDLVLTRQPLKDRDTDRKCEGGR